LLHIDGVFVASTIMLAGLGVLMVFSATRGPGGPANPTVTSYLVKQTGFVVLGFAAMAFAAAIDYRRIRDLAPLVYGGTLFVLVAVLSPVGSASKGAQAWFQVGPFQLQPSEFGKVAVILVLAAYVSRRDGDLQLRHLLTACVLAGVPMALIMLQPDLGTVLVFVAITTGILLVGGARPRHILIVAIIGIAAVVGILNSNLLAQYQKDRLAGFLNPTADVRGSTYNIDQSQITIGAGGVLGRGLFKGPQTRSGQVPEQQTDFIFTVVGEELGFVGAATVLFLYAVLLWRIWRTAKLSRDLFGSLLCVGVFAMILFQLFESVGMTAGIMPVTGIPLPLMSYGGSATVAEFIGLGLVLNVHMRRFA
jgi:rod shape determining protein RodA